MIIYRLTDRIPVKMGEVTVWVAPLSFDQKISLASQTKTVAGQDVVDAQRVAFLCVKYSVKEIEGLTNSDGTPYELSFDPDGMLSDDCVSEMVQMDSASSLISACSLLVGKIAEHKLTGVKIDLKGVKQAKKNG